MTGYLAIMLRNGSKYQSGDILQAFNGNDTKCCQACRICQDEGKEGTYWRRAGSLWEYWCERSHKYRFEYVDKTTVKRITLATQGVEVITKGIDAQTYVNRHHKYIFNDNGKLYWYGKESLPALPQLNEIATEIKKRGKGDLEEPPLNHYPVGKQSEKSFLIMHTADFSDAQRNTWQEEDQKNKRKHTLNPAGKPVRDWLKDSCPTMSDKDIDIVLDPNVEVCACCNKPSGITNPGNLDTSKIKAKA